MTRVVVIEDHTLVRQSLVKTIGSWDGFEVVGEAGCAEDAFELARALTPDVAMLDVELPGEDGLQLAGRMKQAMPELKLVFLTIHEDEATLRGAIAVGADGYVPKTASTDDLHRALRTVAAGGSYLGGAAARTVIDLARGETSPHRLTDRELEVLCLLARGCKSNEVADRLYLSVKTVKNHLTSIYAKLGVKTGAQAVAQAYVRGLVSMQRTR
jgi:DNA-binding NarL/FixJ family response regulator